MKLIIAGSRNFNEISKAFIRDLLQHFNLWPDLTEIVSGGAPGIDRLGEKYAFDTETQIIQFPAYWNKYGKSAGPRRNKQMAEYADALLLIWDGESRGSANMKSQMEKLGKPIYEVILRRS